jgi:para-nitrobenzyl esterase
VLPGTPLTPDGYADALTGLARDDRAIVDKIVQQYPVSKYPTPGDAYAAAMGDAFIKCTGRSTAEALAKVTPVWEYSFAYPKAAFEVPVPGYDLGAFHSAEIQFVFRTPHHPDDPVEQQLAQEMSARWVAFARTGDPTAGLSPAWPTLSGSGVHLVFDEKLTVAKHLDTEACAFWDDLGLTPR